MRAVANDLKYDPQRYGATTMRMVTLGMVVMATVVASAWSLTHTTELTTASGLAAMNPHEMMKSAGEMPVHLIVEPY
jgi:hypothetical protein